MKLNRAHNGQSEFRARLEAMKAAQRQNVETVGDFPAPPVTDSLFKSALPDYGSVDELVTAGNREFENLDLVDFASFRNDDRLGRKTLRKVRSDLAAFHADRTSDAYKKDLSRVLNARYLQGHGLQVEAHLDDKEMRKLRKYVQKETSTNNVADSIRAMNTLLAAGEEDVSALTLGAERHLFTERGVSEEVFAEQFSSRSLADLEKIRDFSDAWSTSQGGKFLSTAQGTDFAGNRDSMAREMLKAHGYQGTEALDLDTVLSLLRDIDSEGPATNASVKKTVNEQIAGGQTEYFRLSTASNKQILRELGVSAEMLEKLEVRDKELTEANPEVAPREERAIRTRVLRDLLRVLPTEERETALGTLNESGANLITAEKSLKKHLGKRIDALTHGVVKYKDMGAMQRANFTAALNKLPEEFRSEVFSGNEEVARDTLEQSIEERFGIEVHRDAGLSPDGSGEEAPTVKEWPVQGLVDLYNAMEGMSKNGKLPGTIRGNATICYVEGSDSEAPSMAVGPQPVDTDTTGPWDRPGAWSHQSGVSGFFGMCDSSSGHDLVYLCDDALKGTNADSAESLTIGESTIIHEFGHAFQLGGTPGADKAVRDREQQQLMAEWSSLSDWREPDRFLADGRMGSFEYYYDPTVQVGKREQVATSYGASDPCEDFAEYTPYFFKAPDIAMDLSLEKFLYYNEMAAGHYSEQKVADIARGLGHDADELAQAKRSLRDKVAHAAEGAGLLSA